MGRNSRKFIDLHTHTYHSDGALSPTKLIEKAEEIGLAAVAITDHDSVTGIKEGIEAGKKLGVEVVPGVEITSYPDEKHEIHFLGYFIDWQSKKLQKVLEQSQKSREKRAKRVVQILNDLGYKINFSDLLTLSKGTIVMPHIAWAVINEKNNKQRLIKEFGEIPRTGDFIIKYLTPGAPAYVPRKTFGQKEVVDLIHQFNGIVVLAHPCWSLTVKVGGKLVHEDKRLNEIINLGIDGIEVLAHRDNQQDTEKCVRHYGKIAKERGLLITGGSDYHGFGNAGKELGYANFYLKVSHKVLEDIKSKIDK